MVLLARDLSTRDRQPELMDQPGLAAGEHDAALAGLRRVNRVSFAARALWRPIVERMRADPSRVWRLLDVASGAGDVPVALARRAARARMSLAVAGCDVSETALRHARGTAERAGVGGEFFLRNVLADGLPTGFDFVTCSLFLHHLDPPEAVRLLQAIGGTVGTLGLVSDLRRTRLGYVLAHAGTRVLSRSRTVHVDGPLSVQGAFTIAEALQLAKEAGLAERVRVRRIWPQRFLMSVEGAAVGGPA